MSELCVVCDRQFPPDKMRSVVTTVRDGNIVFVIQPWYGDSKRPPERDEKLIITESLMLELEFHCKEIEQSERDKEQEERKKKTGVDYSWLMTTPSKSFEISQMERLALEELCYEVKPGEVSNIISAFRDVVLREPELCQLPKLFKACIQQVLSQRPKEETLAEWVTKRTVSLTSIKMRPRSRISPFAGDVEDSESQYSMESGSNHSEDRILPFTTSKSRSLPSYRGTTNPVHLPV